jgi:curved DNA-binding protein CbpA
MKTLYDLLGALPSDEAEGLRTAFRKAVKGAHPDIHPGDPDAGLKFREIVRANEILGDAGQRTAYDHLLELARLEQKSASEQAIAARIHKLASGVIAGVTALAGVSVVTVGVYLLFMQMSAALVAPANKVDVTARGSAEIARVSSAEPPDTTNKNASPVKQESASVPGEAIVPSAAMTQSNSESLPATNAGPAPGPAASAAGS